MSQSKRETVTAEELAQILALRDAVERTEREAQECLLRHDEAKTELAYFVLQLRKKYELRFGDQIDDRTGAIIRALGK